MATIRKRGAFQWQVMIRRKGYPEQSKTFEMKEDAKVWARMIENEMDRGIFVSRYEQENTLLSEALERYSYEVTPTKKGAEREVSRIKQLLRNPIALRYMSNVRPCDIAAYRDTRIKSGISPSTYQKEHSLLSHLFKIARKEWGLTGLENPCDSVNIPVIDNARDRRLKGDEEQRLFKALKCKEMRTIVTLALETGMRRGEIMNLCWESVDIEKRMLISKNKDTKGKNSKKIIALSSKVIAVLEALSFNKAGKVFSYDADQVTRRFRKACKTAKDDCGVLSPIEGLRFHDLRHEATSRLFEKGLSTEQVMKMTGHKTYTMLARYTHLKDDAVLNLLG